MEDYISTLVSDPLSYADQNEPPKKPVILNRQFPTLIDNTMISAYRSCERKFWLEFVYGLRPARPSIHLHAGATYARGLEDLRRAFYGEGLPLSEALQFAFLGMTEEWGDKEWPTDSPKSFARIVDAVAQYVQVYPPDTDPVKPHMTSLGPSVEFTFAIPIPDTQHPDTGESVLYGGRFDMLAEFHNSLFVLDDKTSGQLGAQWAKQWRLRSQFTGYIWAAQQYGYAVAGAIIRGCALKKTATDFADAITYRPQWMIDEWLEGLIVTTREIIAKWNSGSFQKNLADACSSYGGCSYLDLCDKERWKDWVEPNYVEVRWNPVAKDPEVEV